MVMKPRIGRLPKPRVIGEWSTASGITVSLTVRPGTNLAALWIVYGNGMTRIAQVLHDGSVLSEIRYKAPWNQQRPSWKRANKTNVELALKKEFG